MIQFNKILDEIVGEIVGEKEIYVQNTFEKTNLNKLIDKVIFDTEKLIISNLKVLKTLLNKEKLDQSDKETIDVILSNYKRYFDRSKGGTPEVNRGFELQKQLENLVKSTTSRLKP